MSGVTTRNEAKTAVAASTNLFVYTNPQLEIHFAEAESSNPAESWCLGNHISYTQYTL